MAKVEIKSESHTPVGGIFKKCDFTSLSFRRGLGEAFRVTGTCPCDSLK